MLEKICTGLVRGLLGVILLVLAVLSAGVTCRVYGGAEIVEYGRDIPLLHLLFCGGLLAWIVWRRKKKDASSACKLERREASGRDGRKIQTGWFLLITAFLYLLWVILVPSWGGADSHQCMKAAENLLEGKFAAWDPVPFSYGKSEDPVGYAYTYPSQNGLIIYMAFLRFFFGDATYAMFQVLNIVFFMLGIVSLQKMITGTENENGNRMLRWMALFLPFAFYILFVYGTMPGFGLSCLAMERILCYVKNGRKRDFWIGSAAAAAAVYLKSNYEIVLIGLFLYLLSSAVFRRKIRLLAASLLLIVVYLAGNRGLHAGLEMVTGRPISDGAPMIAWVEMGLQESSRGPGWYNGYQISLFQKADGDSELASAWAQADLHKTLSEMTEKPGETVDFFVRKIESIWAEPTFQSLWIQEVGNTLWTEESLPWQLFQEEGVLNRIYVFAANLMQTFVYAMACIWVVTGMSGKDWRTAGEIKMRAEMETTKEAKTAKRANTQKKMGFQKLAEHKTIDHWGMLLPGIVFIGGFLFHLFWEAKGQYSVVYFMLLLPYAYLGAGRAADMIIDVKNGWK